MKKMTIMMALVMFLLVGCGQKEDKNLAVAVVDDTIEPTTQVSIVSEPESIEEIPRTTVRATSRSSNLYIEVETTKKEERKYTYVFKMYDDCQAKGQELLPAFQKLHPEILKTDCMYVKDRNNSFYWGVYFQTCDDPLTICNFYY